ncbi:nitric oxide synthase oxygenase [Catellatospora sp. NPDC049609]|uniref:nitric oxide synthase oxygenase n=1 Tax=Catellatospora sp. NPDC049609 TaxID=3155505 RepID=UPI003449BBEA
MTDWDPDRPVDFAEAEEFLRTCYAELPKLGPVEPRLAVVREQIAALGTYTHTHAELVHGARMAWRNASRCIGRVYWRSLTVLDRRQHRDPDRIFDDLVSHLHMATGEGASRGRLRAVISIFGQAVPGRPVTRLWNDQLIRYAGHRKADGFVGDPQYEQFTEAVTRLGWTGKGSAFDLLPLVLQTDGGEPRLYELPESAVLEVPLAHPEYGWFAELGLRWHAVPAIANMRLSIGGVDYPLAPFSGWYMGTEIGARNLADAQRYHQIPVIAARMGLDTGSESTLWRDRALVELNRAVLWSFERAGVRVTDHHSESRLFLTHVERERRAGRDTPADWTWIVPPMSGGLTPVFHRYYTEADQRPNFYLDHTARDLSLTGTPAAVRVTVPAQRTAVERRTAETPRGAIGHTGARCPVTGQTAPEPTLGPPTDLPPDDPTRTAPLAPATVDAAALAPAAPDPAALYAAGYDPTAVQAAGYDPTGAQVVVRDAVPAGSAPAPIPAEPVPARKRGLRRLLG